MPTSVWDLFTNEITNHDFVLSSIRNDGPLCFGPPILDVGLPSFVAFTHPAGPYQPTLPSFPSAAALGALPDVHLTIQGSDLARFYIRSDGLGPATFAFTLGYNSLPNCPATIAVHGQFFIPNGRINLGDCTNIFGRVWADVIRNDTNINVTYRAAAALGGTKFFDADADGQIDPGESGLAGQTFYVDYDDDGILDPGEPSGVSDANGTYVIDDVAAGTWTLRELGAPGFVCSFPAACHYAITIGDGEVQTGLDFANWTGITKSGTKFEDLDADGSAREPGEPGLTGWTIFVDYDGDGTLDPDEPFDVTDATGAYLMVNITPGTWKVREVGQSPWSCSPQPLTTTT